MNVSREYSKKGEGESKGPDTYTRAREREREQGRGEYDEENDRGETGGVSMCARVCARAVEFNVCATPGRV